MPDLESIDQRVFSVEVRVKKMGYADSRRKGIADFLVYVLGSAPLDQLVFSLEISGKKGLR